MLGSVAEASNRYVLLPKTVDGFVWGTRVDHSGLIRKGPGRIQNAMQHNVHITYTRICPGTKSEYASYVPM